MISISRSLRSVLWMVPLLGVLGPASGAVAQQATQGDDSGVASAITGEFKQDKKSTGKSKDGLDPKSRGSRSAEDAFIAGARLLEHNDRVGAEREFTRAVALVPDNRDYTMALEALRNGDITDLVHRAGKARLLGHDAEAESLLAEARKIDPSSPILLQHPVPGPISKAEKVNSWIVDGPRLALPVQLKPTGGVKTLHIRATMPEAVKQVAATYGIKASLDSSVTGTQQIKFDLDDVPYEQAMRVLMQMGSNFAVPLTPDSIFVAKDNEENRQKYLRLVQETIYAAGMTNEQIAELGNMIKNVFEVKQVSVENSFGTLVIRAPEETLRVLNLTLADMLDGGSEVMIDLKLYSLDKMRTVNIGATVPSQASAFSFSSQANALVAANQSLVSQAIAQGLISPTASNVEIAIALLESGLVTSTLLTNLVGSFGGGISLFGLDSNISPTFNLALNSSDTRALDEIQLRMGDRQSATFRAGSKYPITQSTYSTTTAASAAGIAGATINGVSVASLLNAATTATVPQVQYEDLGVTLKATPTVQKSGMISLHLDLKIESLAGGTIDNIPILNNDAYVSDIMVGDGQTAFLVSNMTKSESAAVTGIPGLSDLPGFQSSPELEKTTDVGQLLMVLTPHLVRKRANGTAGPRIPIATPASTATD